MNDLHKILMGITIVALGSCNDFLEEQPISQIGAETFYEDALSAEIGLTGV